jgi:hypothetical protein
VNPPIVKGSSSGLWVCKENLSDEINVLPLEDEMVCFGVDLTEKEQQM